MYAILGLSIFTTTFLGTKLPKIEVILMIFYILGFFACMIPVVYLGPHGNAASVFDTFVNGGGFDTMTLSFFVGMTGNAFVFLGKWSSISTACLTVY